jgi:predicted porin
VNGTAAPHEIEKISIPLYPQSLFMKTSTLLFTAACGLASSGAFAQSSVTIYGVVDTAILYQGDPVTGSGSKWSVSGGGENSSRFGLLGAEDLGGGNKAFFRLESGFLSNNGQNTMNSFFGRAALVGLETHYGTISAGRQLTPYYLDAVIKGDAMEAGYVNYIGTVFNLYSRVSNSVQYSTPRIKGLRLDLMYGFSNTAGDFNAGSSYNGALDYSNGPLHAAIAAYRQYATTGGTVDHSEIVSASYDTGPVIVYGAASLIRSGLSGVPGVTKQSTNVNAYSVSATWKMSAFNSLKFDVHYATDEREGPNTGGNALVLGAAYTYLFSKRTNVYVMGGHIFNHGSMQYSTIDSTSPAYGQTAFAIGLDHKF